MTAQKGKDLLIKIADGAGYTTVAGLRTRRLSFNAETVEGILLAWSGSAWVTASSATSGRELLTANRTYYVRTDGSNSNTGLANTAAGAFLTIQKAIDVVAALDISIYTVTIQIGNGTYTGANVLKAPAGSGEVIIVGDETTPSNVLVSVTNANCFSGTFRGIFRLRGMKMTAATTGSLISITGGGAIVYHKNNDYGAAPSFQLNATNGANIVVEGNYAISAGAFSHMVANGPGAYVNIGGSTVTLSGTPAFTTFASVILAGVINAPNNVTFSGSATGVRYSALENGVIRTNGGGANWLPGNSAGSTANGGQYT